MSCVNAKRSRKPEPTQRAILDKLRTLKICKYFQPPSLRDITLLYLQVDKTWDRSPCPFVSDHRAFQSHEPGQKANFLDGLCVFISNHCETTDGHFCVSLDTLIRSYREKSVIEDAFKHLKSFLHLRPFYVHRDE